MCTISVVIENYRNQFPKRYPEWDEWPWPNTAPSTKQTITYTGVNQEEFDALKEEVEQLKKLLTAAKDFDDATGQPDCEADEKVAFIRKIADAVGVSMEDVFPENDNG